MLLLVAQSDERSVRGGHRGRCWAAGAVPDRGVRAGSGTHSGKTSKAAGQRESTRKPDLQGLQAGFYVSGKGEVRGTPKSDPG